MKALPLRVAGIDFGTTYSLIAVPTPEGPITLTDPEGGGDLLPSVVETGLPSIKRFLGRTRAEILADFPEIDPAQLREDAEGLFCLTPQGPRSPEELATQIFKRLAHWGNRYYGAPLQGVVITVPTYFDLMQRQAIEKAASAAGLTVLQCLPEPTAAALAYGLNYFKQGTIAVYDLGGGTFDFTLLARRQDTFEVKAIGGINCFGGEDVDRVLARILQERGIPLPFAALKTLARAAKHQLSSQSECCLEGPQGSFILNRSEVTEQIAPLISKTIAVVRSVLKRAGIAVQTIDHLILVGGSSRLPQVYAACESFFEKAPEPAIDPERMVAWGAALKAQSLIQPEMLSLVDITPLTLGLETLWGGVEAIIPRHTPLPTRQVQYFTNGIAHQSEILFHVVQGDAPEAAACRSLGRFTLKGLPPVPAGQLRLEVIFTLDSQGRLTVTATHAESQAALTLIPTRTTDCYLTLGESAENPDTVLEEAQQTLAYLAQRSTAALEPLQTALQNALVSQDRTHVAALLKTVQQHLLPTHWIDPE